MANNKNNVRSKAWSFFSDTFLLSTAALVACLLVWSIWSYSRPDPTKDTPTGFNEHAHFEPETFYDDPELSYTIDAKIENWDEKRKQWKEKNGELLISSGPDPDERIVMVTGSQSKPCKNPIGDYLLLRLFKNKVDYCRLHGYEVYYNNVLLHPDMLSFWAKLPAIKSAMLAHPEAEWIWWVDSDAAFTDMGFKLPLGRYKAHNMVVHGWENMVQERSWTSVNAGVFLIRNCQWAMDLIHEWSQMGPNSNAYTKWGKTLRSIFKDKIFPESDDQSGLIYLYFKEREKFGSKIYLEGEYYFEGYWVEIVGRFDNITRRYLEFEKGVRVLRRRHGEVESVGFGKVWEEHVKDDNAGGGYGKDGWRRPFITHFTGCQPCSGAHNAMYTARGCWEAMIRALNFADNQVMRNYGFMHPDLSDSSTVKPVPFDFPHARA